jgi:hypothetical protein
MGDDDFDEGIRPEPLREPSREDDGEPMPPDALAEQERLDRAAEAAHVELDRARKASLVSPPRRVLAILRPPMSVTTFTAVLDALCREFPASTIENDQGGYIIYDRTDETEESDADDR